MKILNRIVLNYQNNVKFPRINPTNADDIILEFYIALLIYNGTSFNQL
jgi:hypothetical protein